MKIGLITIFVASCLAGPATAQRLRMQAEGQAINFMTPSGYDQHPENEVTRLRKEKRVLHDEVQHKATLEQDQFEGANDSRFLHSVLDGTEPARPRNSRGPNGSPQNKRESNLVKSVLRGKNRNGQGLGRKRAMGMGMFSPGIPSGSMMMGARAAGRPNRGPSKGAVNHHNIRESFAPGAGGGGRPRGGSAGAVGSSIVISNGADVNVDGPSDVNRAYDPGASSEYYGGDEESDGLIFDGEEAMGDEPQPESVPEAQPEPSPVPQPEPSPVPQPESVPEPQPELSPVPQLEPLLETQPEPLPQPMPASFADTNSLLSPFASPSDSMPAMAPWLTPNMTPSYFP